MYNRSTMSRSSFSEWLEQQKAQQNVEEMNQQDSPGIFAQFTALQDNVSTQLQSLSGSLPEAGPLSSAFRTRVVRAVYLLIASGVFAILALIIGLPTLLIRPTKFVICITLSTLLASASVVVMQTPSVFVATIMNGGIEKALPVIGLGLSTLFTLYVSIFIHRYIHVIAAGAIQVVLLLYYLSSFIPGGKQGLAIVLKTTYMIVRTIVYPVYFLVKKTIIMCLSKLFE